MPPRPNIPSMIVAGGVAVHALEPLNALEENELGHPRRTVGEKPAAGQTGIKVYLEKLQPHRDWVALDRAPVQ